MVVTNLRNHECLDTSRVRNMGPNAKVNHGSTPVHRRRSTIRNLGLDNVYFVFVVL